MRVYRTCFLQNASGTILIEDCNHINNAVRLNLKWEKSGEQIKVIDETA